jgi:hypothetical protein
MDMTGTGKAAGPGATPVGNAALPPAVPAASGPGFADDVTVRHPGRLLHSGKESITYFVPFRLVRDESESERPVRYVGENPAKAGLRDWRWVWGQDGPAAAAGTPASQKLPLPGAGATES